MHGFHPAGLVVLAVAAALVSAVPVSAGPVFPPLWPPHVDPKSPLLSAGPMLGDGALGGFKISDNESPAPMDRVYFSYNFFSDAPIDVHRETFGFEKTFLDNQASFGMRVPFVQTVLPAGSINADVGDLSLIGKYAFLNDPSLGVVSGGLMVSLPTMGGSLEMQPFVGWIAGPASSPLYFNGFHALSIPIMSPSGSYLTNDVGVGYRIYPNNGLVAVVIPTAELHINSPVQAIDLSNINLGLGGHVEFNNGTLLGAGLNLPLAGPKPYDAEAVVNFSVRY